MYCATISKKTLKIRVYASDATYNVDNVYVKMFLLSLLLFIIGADYVVRRAPICDEFVRVCVGGWVGGYVSMIKRKPLIGMT